jgi:hypothetical protein
MPSPRPSVTPSTYTVRVRILSGFYAPPDARQIWRELELDQVARPVVPSAGRTAPATVRSEAPTDGPTDH